MDWTVDILKQVPSLAVLAWLVHRGLQTQKDAVALFVDRLRERDLVLRQIEEHCHEIQKDSVAAISKNTAVMAEVREILRSVRFHGGSIPPAGS